MYLGQKDTKSLAALIEFAEMLMPRVTIRSPMAPKAEAARPLEDPVLLQASIMTIGFQTISPYTGSDAAAVKIPSRPTMAREKAGIRDTGPYRAGKKRTY